MSTGTLDINALHAAALQENDLRDAYQAPARKNVLTIAKATEGDMQISWDPNIPAEVAAAREQFDRMKDKKYLAYRTDGDGASNGELIRTFDPTAAEIVMMPQTVGG